MLAPTAVFSLNNDVRSNDQKSTNANASVVINNHVASQFSADPYPDVTSDGITINEYVPSAQKQSVTQEDIEDYISPEFYVRLSEITTELLARNDRALLINIIDQTGHIIVTARQLIDLVALITRCVATKVNILYHDETDDAKCCIHKISPIKQIDGITINQKDFVYTYNREYNILKNKFHISLDKCIISR